MKCPYCQSESHGVVETRSFDTVVFRRRLCYSCDQVFKTKEEKHNDPIGPVQIKDIKPTCKQLFVYFVLADNGLIKIGVTDNVQKRLETIRAVSPCGITLIKSIEGNRKVETEIHKKFKHLRKHGEWFLQDFTLLEFIKNLSK